MPSESYHTDNSQTPSGNISPSQTRTEISQHTSISPPSPSVPTGQNPLQIQDGLPLPSRYWAILSIALGLTVSVLDGAIANVALPTIAKDLDTSPAASIWIVNAYQLAITISLLSLSSLGDILGYRRIYIAGLFLFSCTSLLCIVRLAAHADHFPDASRFRGRSNRQCQYGAYPYHLPVPVPRQRNGYQRIGRLCFSSGRANRRCRHPVGSELALAFRNQYPNRHRGTDAQL